MHVIYRISLCTIIFLIALIVSKKNFAQCDTEISPDENKEIAYKERGNRCEGYYVGRVGCPSIDLVGLVRGHFTFAFNREEEIITVESSITDRSINLRAVGVPLRTYYQMDAILAPNERFEWPVEDIIYPMRLNAEIINIYGWIGSENQKIYIPVKSTSYLNSSVADSIVRLYIRTNTEVSKVIWRVARYNQGYCENFEEWNEIIKNYNEGIAIPLEILKRSGLYCIHVKARKSTSGNWGEEIFKVLINEN